MECPRPADRVDAREKPSHPGALVLRREFGPAPALPWIDRVAEAAELEQRAARVHLRRHDRQFCAGEFQREFMLLQDRGRAPPSGPIELDDHRRRIVPADLVDAILVAVERQHPAVRRMTHGLDRLDDEVRRERGIRMHSGRLAACDGVDIVRGEQCIGYDPQTSMLRPISLRPRSLSGLILLGFAAVALPLLLGTINAAVEMRNLSSASERLVATGVAATQYTQAIVRQVSSLERTARLYQILRRASLLETFRQNHQLLVTTLGGLEQLPGDPARAEVIDRIRQTTDAIERGLGSPAAADVNDALRRFTQLAKDAGQLSTLASLQTDRELKQLRAETDQTRRRILWQSAALVPVSLGLMLLFTVFLGRPIREIDRAIDAIGHGRFERSRRRARSHRPAGPRPPARMAAQPPRRDRRGTQPVPAPHVARTEDAAREHPRRHRTVAGGRRRRTERRATGSGRHPARQQPASAAADREPAVLQRMARAPGGARPRPSAAAGAGRARRSRPTTCRSARIACSSCGRSTMSRWSQTAPSCD